MRERGASTVAVVVLVAIILVCVGLIVYRVSKNGASATSRKSSPVTVDLKCGSKDCGWSKTVSETEAAGMARGAAFNEADVELIQCPKCKKFSVGQMKECPTCHKKFLDLGKGCPNCKTGK